MTPEQVLRDGKLPWDAECNTTRAAMDRFLRALVYVDGHFTDAHTLGNVMHPLRYVHVHFRVWLPEGREAEFVSLAKVEIKPPPRVDLGWSAEEKQP